MQNFGSYQKEALLTKLCKTKGRRKLGGPLYHHPLPIHTLIAQQENQNIQPIPVPVQNSNIEANSPVTNEFADEFEQMLEENTHGTQSGTEAAQIGRNEEQKQNENFDETNAQIQFNIGEFYV